MFDDSAPEQPHGPLFESRSEALWYLCALTGSMVSISAFFLAGAFWPESSFTAGWVIMPFAAVCIGATNRFLSKKTKGLSFGRRWTAQMRLQQRLGTKEAFEELFTVLGWNPGAAPLVRRLVYGVPIVCWALVFVRSLD